ncbi:MAG: hypothetical protein AAF236_09630 [Verrucomicrobiota bacterium]
MSCQDKERLRTGEKNSTQSRAAVESPLRRGSVIQTEREIILDSGDSIEFEETVAQLESIISGLRAVPVNVEIKVVPVEEAAAREEMPVEIKSATQQEDKPASG